MKLTQKNFDKLIENLNHKMGDMENSIRLIKNDMVWMKRTISWWTPKSSFACLRG